MVFILDEPRTVRPGLSVKQEGPILPNGGMGPSVALIAPSNWARCWAAFQ